MFANKVVGVINSFEVASQRPPIFVSPVDDVLVDCCLCFAHRWKGMAPSYKEMSLQQRKHALGRLLSLLEDGVLPWGSFTIVADEMGVTRSTISRLWGLARGAREQSLILTPEIASRNNSRAKSLKYSHAEFRQGLKEIPRRRRKTYRSTAKAMGVSLNTVQRMLLHEDVCRVHTSSLKPTLTEENKMSRMELALSFVDKNNPSQFENMEDLIHIDEKWFFLTKDGQRFIIAADEEEPYRHVQHKNFMTKVMFIDEKWFFLTKDGQRFIIAADEEEPYRHVQHKNFMTKVMFLCAVARPRYDTNKNAWFDGKIGIWPIGKWEPAKRKSKNRAKGTPVWKNQLINRDVYREYLIQKLLPAVKEKWPRNNARIRLQQDGAKSHILEDDVEFKEAVQQIGLNLTVFTQAPNSPDTNILDLGFFRAIQSANDACPDNEEELIKSVEKAYGEYPWCKLNFVWLTLQSCLNKIIEHDGGNDYKIPHMGKESLWRRGRLPEVLHVTPAANAWLNPTMDDDSDEDSDDSGDEMLFPMSTATSTVAMDGEGGENAPTDGITTTGV